MTRSDSFKFLFNKVFFADACSLWPEDQPADLLECQTLIHENMRIGLENSSMLILRELKLLNEKLAAKKYNKDVLGEDTYKEIGNPTNHLNHLHHLSCVCRLNDQQAFQNDHLHLPRGGAIGDRVEP